MTAPQKVSLVAIGKDGELAEKLEGLPDVAKELCAEMPAFYAKVGFAPPWIGYLTLRDGACVGTCAIKGAPQAGVVEIAYFTFPDFEGQGLGRAAAHALMQLAWKKDPTLTIMARTLPETNASTSILQRLGFTLAGKVRDAHDGEVWEWRLAAPR